MLPVIEEAYRLRRIAESGPIGKRHSSFELYDLLGQCMTLAEKCQSGKSYDDIRSLVVQKPRHGRNRTYIEAGSDEFILVCRFVFGDLKSSAAERSNASRYAHCLRQAYVRGVRGADLSAYLRDNGGINALFLNRPLKAKTISTKCLRLTTAISVPKDGVITVQLKHRPDNQFDVLWSSK